jgi:cobalamin biosynthetic protein CobC
MLVHGGNLQDAIIRFGRPREAWLDLSTGINPQPYPVPVLRNDIWHHLPEARSDFLHAAQTYYQTQELLPVAGSQAAIQTLPRLRAVSRVVVATPSYAEHAYAWRCAGHDVREVPFDLLDDEINNCDVMVVCNPNNPTGAVIEPHTLLAWAEQLAQRGGWLIVDEAFMDVTPSMSVVAHAHRPGLTVLRSIGKFFGLAGLRLGFVAAEPNLLKKLADLLGPWTISSAAQEIGYAALLDYSWQEMMRNRLLLSGEYLHQLLTKYGIGASRSALFQWWPEPRAETFWLHMAQQGIWVRHFQNNDGGIRLGLPADEAGWQRLEQGLASWILE